MNQLAAESRMAMLMLFHDFVMRPENNRFGYDYQVNHQSDLTPLLYENILEPEYAYIPDSSIVNILMAVYKIYNDTLGYQQSGHCKRLLHR
jgi:hypothetical protein